MTLSILIWLPLAAGLAGALLPRRIGLRVVQAGGLATLGIAIYFVTQFDRGAAGLQFVTDTIWISQLGIHYKLGLSGLNMLLIVLATLLFAAAMIAAGLRQWERPRLFFFWFALAESAVLGALTAQDLILFVGFFDLMLIPFYFLTGQWGGRERVRATMKMIIYTFVGSLLMLVGAVATGVIAAADHGTQLTFAISELRALPLSKGSQEWIFLCFAAAFLVKMPAFPFHAWLPDGYRAMPLPALGVFSGVVSKVAAYGFLAIVLPLFPAASVHFQMLMLLIALASILYGSVNAFTTRDLRLVIAYSSVAQLGFITLGIFSLRPEGAQGALLQMLNHGLVTLPLFLIVALVAARAGGSEDLRDMGGIAFRAPVLAAIFLVISLATLAMPGSSNFIGEFLILLGVFKAKIVISIVAFIGVVLASVYMLRAYIRAMHKRIGERVSSRDITLGDAVALVPLTLCVIAFALYPQFALQRSERSAKASIAKAQALSVAPAVASKEGPGAQALRDARLAATAPGGAAGAGGAVAAAGGGAP